MHKRIHGKTDRHEGGNSDADKSSQNVHLTRDLMFTLGMKMTRLELNFPFLLK